VKPWRRKPDAPCECGCGELARRLAESEALTAAIVRAIVTLRPRRAIDGVAAGLIGWGVNPDDARLLAEAIRPRPA
jgi:hypothetical protein